MVASIKLDLAPDALDMKLVGSQPRRLCQCWARPLTNERRPRAIAASQSRVDTGS
jgi:hypothetical protein